MEISMEIDSREERLAQVYRAENVTCKDIERTDVTFLLDRNPKIERPLCEAFPQRCALTSGRAYDLRQRDAINWNYSEISSTSFVTDFHGRCDVRFQRSQIRTVVVSNRPTFPGVVDRFLSSIWSVFMLAYEYS